MTWYRRLCELGLDLLFPQSQAIRNLEHLTAAELWAEAGQPRTISEELRISALFDYQNRLMRRMIWQLKYKGNTKVARLFAECLYEELLAMMNEAVTLDDFRSPMLIPMPISDARRKARGYNQCELALGELARLDLHRTFEYRKDILEKFKDTKPQTETLTRRERLDNLGECFRVRRPEQLKGRNVFLVDDVTTTGATLTNARQTILRAGARRVVCIALAH